MPKLVAETRGPPHRRFSVHFEPGGWCFNAWTFDDHGTEVRWQDFWDPTIRELLPTIVHHSAPHLIWTDEVSGEQIATNDLAILDERFPK